MPNRPWFPQPPAPKQSESCVADAAKRQSLEFATSVLASLAGFAALFLPPVLGFSLLIAGFLMQALWDVLSVEAGNLPPWFGKLRMILTAGAVVALLALLLRLLI